MEEKLLIKITTDISGLKKGMSKASGEMDKIKTKTSKISTGFKKLGGVIAGAFAVKAVVGFGKKVVEVGAELEAMDALFSEVFADEGPSKVLDKIAAQSKELSIHGDRLKKTWTNFGLQLKGAGMEGAEALEATEKATLLAADAAAAYNVSLEDSQGSLASFMRGNFEAGAAIGVFTNASSMDVKAKEKMGKGWKDLTQAERQWLLLDTVGEIYESTGVMGQAAREADGYENVMNNLKSVWERFLQVIGSPLLGVVVEVVQLLTDKISQLTEWIKSFDWGKITESEPMLLVKDIIGYIQDGVGFLWEKVTAFNWGSITNSELFVNIRNIIGDVRDRIQWVVDKVKSFDWAALANSEPITLVKDALGFVYDKINEVLVAVQEFDWGVITDSQLFEVIKDVFQWLVDNVPVAVQHIADFFTKIIESEQAQAIFTAIKDAASVLADKILNIKDTAKQFSDWAIENQNILIGLATFFGSIAAMVGLYNIGMAIANTATGVWTAVSTAASLATTALGVAFLSINWPLVLIVGAIAAVIAIGVLLWKNWDTVKEKAGQLLTAFKEKFQAIKDKVVEVFNNIKTAMSEKFEAAKKAVSDKVEAIKKKFGDTFQAVKDAVVNKFQEIKQGITDKIDAAKTTVGDTVDGIKDKFSTAFEDAKKSVLGIFDKIKDGISEKITAAKDKVSEIIDKIKGFFDFEFKLPKIPKPSFGVSPAGWKIGDLLKGSLPKLSINWNARGAIFKKPTLLGNGQGVGDASNGFGSSPEVVAPLSDLKQMLGLGEDKGNITINLNGNYSFRDKEDMDYLMNQMALQMRRA